MSQIVRSPFDRVVVTGQVGVDKGAFVRKIGAEMESLGRPKPNIENTGQLMYAEDPSIPPGEILKLDRGRLRALRRSIMHGVLERASNAECTLLNTHASFRWSNGLFLAQDQDQLSAFKPKVFLNVVDNFHEVWARLQGHSSVEHSMRDVLLARETEQLATSALAQFVMGGPKPSYLVARGPNDRRARAIAELLSGSNKLKVYPSFPMTHVARMPDVRARINRFRDRIAEHAIVFDPGDVDEKEIMEKARELLAAGKTHVPHVVDGKEFLMPAEELLSVEGEVDRQICERDYLLIDGSDMIVSLVPKLPDGMPALSSGVERELQYAYGTGKLVFVVWEPTRVPSPFIGKQLTRLYRSEEELLEDFDKRGFLKAAA